MNGTKSRQWFLLLGLMTARLIALPANTYPPVQGQDTGGGRATAVIPKKTEIVMSLQSTISTRTAMVGDKFYGQVSVPVVAEDHIVVPVGSWVVGEVRSSQRAGRIRGRAELQLGFNNVILPSGETRQIVGRLRAVDGYKSAEIDRSEGGIRSETQKGEDAGTIAKGAGIGSVVVGSASRSVRGAALGGAGGALAGLGLTMLGRGDDVELQRGTQITLILDQDVSLVKK
jgi:hypothetical protein